MTPTRLTVALIGPGQQENLPLAYLAAALIDAGHTARLIRFDHRNDLAACVQSVMTLNPRIVGMSIAFQYAVIDSIELIASLRRAGYRGHITCGGHVPTFCYEALLRDAPGLDSVVRHDGETTLTALAAAITNDQPLDELEGLIWRDSGDIRVNRIGAPVDIDTLPPPVRPRQLFQIGGVPVTFLLTSRGCVGECHYCSIRAFTKSSGGPRYRLRHPELVGEEVAALYHERGARVFFIQDDLFILPNERATLARIASLRKSLEARRVTEGMFWIKGRPESITPDVLKAAKAMGARHLFLGIEHADNTRLAYLGRRHRHDDNVRAIRLAREAGIRPSFNLMIFDPESRLSDVERVMAFAETCPELPWNLCRTEIYPGTHLFEQLQGDGRLEGDYRTFGYTMQDPEAETLFRMLRVSLHEHAFDVDSLLNKLISLSFARQIHERYFPGKVSDALSRDVDALIRDAHRDTVDIIRESIDFIKSRDAKDPGAVRRFAVETGMRLVARDAPRFQRFEGLWNQLSATGTILFSLTRSTVRSA